MIKKIFKEYYLYIFIFLLFLYFGLLVPTGGDDWEISFWYSFEGLFSLLCKSIYMWTFYNGRILNNFFDMFLSKYCILWAFSSALIQTLTIYFGLKIFKLEKSKLSIILSLILILSVSSGFRMETQIHKIGNISYAIPTFLIFLLLYLIHANKDKENDNLKNLFIGLLALASSLFIENLTIGITGLIFVDLIYEYLKTKKINKMLLFSLIGCLVGCLILYTSPGFLNRYNNTTGDNSFLKIIMTNLPIFLYRITIGEKCIYLIYGVISLLALHNYKKSRNIILKLYFIFLDLYLLLYNLLEIFAKSTYTLVKYYDIFLKYFVNSNFAILIMISMLVSVFLMIIIISHKDNKVNLIGLYLLSLFSAGPMILEPGERNFILLIYSLIFITVSIFGLVNLSKFSKKYKYLPIIFLGIILGFRIENYHYVLYNAHLISKDREEIINNYKANQYLTDNNVLILPKYGNEIFGNLNSDYYKVSIVNYYNLKADTKVLFDDNFLFDDINITKDKEDYSITIKLLKNDNFVYYLKIYDNNTNELLLDTKQDDNVFHFSFEKNKSYLISCTIQNEKGEYIIENKGVNFENEN